jgi:hypothetical protein
VSESCEIWKDRWRAQIRREAVYAVASKLMNIRSRQPWYYDLSIIGDDMAKGTLFPWYRYVHSINAVFQRSD